MKIVLAPDKFKGSLTAREACAAMERGVRRVWPDAEVVSIPLADGGEGTVDALVVATGGRFVEVAVMGPLGEPVEARFGILGNERTAVIEMAQASGLWLLPPEQRNPLKTTSYGTGELIKTAVGQGCRRLIVGIGGSATTDCGSGMAQALGMRFLRADGSIIKDHMTGELMGRVRSVDLSNILPELNDCSITVACDVTNPLLGPNGAVMVYSAQKGAAADQLEQLERNMENIIGVMESATGRKVRNLPGAGAAGGLGAGLMTLFRAMQMPGIEVVLEAVAFRERIRGAALVFTGEGRVDAQTACGKTVGGVLRAACMGNTPVIVLAGSVEDGAESLYREGAVSMFSICTRPMTLSEAMSQAAKLLETAAERVARVARLGSFSSP
jgi:glycerate kinase